MGLRIAADFGNRVGDTLLPEPRLNELFGIRVHRNGEALCLELPDASEQVREIGDEPVADRTHDGARLVIEPGWQEHAEFQGLAVGKVHV